MRKLGTDERRKATQVDAELDESTASTLWWENDSQLRDRYRSS